MSEDDIFKTCFCCGRRVNVVELAMKFRSQHLMENGILPASALPFHALKESEQAQWLNKARATVKGEQT